MRRFILPGTFFILVAATFFLWQYRFERSPGCPVLNLADLRTATDLPPGAEWLPGGNGLRLTADGIRPGVVVRLDFPEMKAVDRLQIRFFASVRGLKPGKESWEDGRVLIEWHPAAGGAAWESDPVCSGSGDEDGVLSSWVMRPEKPPAIPALRVENLGTAGSIELTRFEATVVRERLSWKIGHRILLVAWLGWLAAWVVIIGKNGFIRASLAATVWLLMGIYFVIPGPWKSLRPLGVPFQIGAETPATRAAPVVPAEKSPPAALPPVLESAGRIPDKGDITLWLKIHVARSRPLLHILLLFGPVLASAWLAGRQPAWTLGALFSFAVEAAQYAFGFGFDAMDCFDLLCDAAGIALALAAYRSLKRRAGVFFATRRSRAAAS